MSYLLHLKTITQFEDSKGTVNDNMNRVLKQAKKGMKHRIRIQQSRTWLSVAVAGNNQHTAIDPGGCDVGLVHCLLDDRKVEALHYKVARKCMFRGVRIRGILNYEFSGGTLLAGTRGFCYA